MGRLFDSKQFRTDLELSGSFSGSFQGDGSSLTNVNVTPGDLPSGLVSSSAQIASDISGSFGAPSSSFSTRITNLKTDSGSFSTRISSNELITAKTLISSSAQIALDISGSFTAPSASFSTRISSNETITSKTLVSSSAQIASDISGSFGGPSASFSTRVSANEIVTAKTLISSSNQFNNINSPFTGSFSGSFQGDGSGLTNIVAVGTLSSSAQIASDISGAFAGPSSSFSTRVSANEIVTAKTLLSGSTQITEFGFVSQSGGIVDLPNTKIQYANVYSSLVDLPPAGNYHGMFAHVHGTGKGYYAHAGNWIELANISVTSSIDSNTSAISTLNSSGLLSSSAQIGSEISGSFTQPSGSFSSRVTTLEDQSIYSGSFSGSFQGNGSNITGVTVDTASYTSIWSLGAVGSDHYTITGPGLTGAENDPDIYLTRGEVYKFNNDNSGGAHPFQIQTIGGSAYGDGVTNNGGAGGTSIEIDVQFDAPTKLFYQCTSHANMRGIIYIADAINHSGSFSGSFQGDGSGLENIPASGITGLNLSRIASGSATASISPNGGFQINTNITASNISSSGTLRIQEIDAFKMNVVHFTASFITASTIETSGSNVFGDEPSDTHTFIGNIIAKNNISSSGYVSASNFIGNGSGLTNVFEGTSASQSISTRITTNESAINTLNTSGLLSGSAQIATEISGAFGASSSSFSTRTTSLENKTIYSGSFSGSFQGNGSGLTNIPASGITGLNLSRIASGSVTASIAPDKGFEINTNITASGNVSSSATSTASFGTYLGDGSQLSGIVTATDFTQSLFVSPSGDDSTATAGDMMKPFATILAATGSANPGDTIIVYPGTYPTPSQILKDHVNYYFYPGAIVSGSSENALMGGVNMQFEKINVRGAGSFIGGASFGTHGGIIHLHAVSQSSHFEYDTITSTKQSTAYNFTMGIQSSITTEIEFYVKGNLVQHSGSGGGGLNEVVRLSSGKNRLETAVRAPLATAGTVGIRQYGTSGDHYVDADVYMESGIALYSNNRNTDGFFKGRYEVLSTAQPTYYAVYLGDGYNGFHTVDAEVRGGYYLATGGVSQGGIHIRGNQVCHNSPGSAAVVINSSGNYQLDQYIFSYTGVFSMTADAVVKFNGTSRLGAENKLFNITAGKFIYAGSDIDGNNRAVPSIVSGGHLVIDAPLDHDGGNYPSNRYMFNLSGGTLEINNTVTYHQQTAGSGFVNMTGGYLILDGARLIQDNGTGSFAYAINLNSSAHSGSIFNNSFTNLTPFGNTGSFTNEIIGGGTLFESHKLY